VETTLIRIENLSKSFGSKNILKKFSYHFPEGKRISVVGANGAGKTTLLNILTGKEEADSGEIFIPKNFEIGFLPQIPNTHPKESIQEECLSGNGKIQALKAHLDKLTDLLTTSYSPQIQDEFDKAEELYRNAGGYSALSRAKGILVGLGFTSLQLLENPLTLSGGWRMRLELAKIFLNQPDFLILDEPTNHLDLPSLVWVENYLSSYQGTLLFVSHDRALLDKLANITIHLSHGNLDVYKGNFSFFLDEREKRQELLQAQSNKLQDEKEQIVKFVERFGAQATKAKQAQSRLKRLEKLELEEENLGYSELKSQEMVFAPSIKNQGPKKVCEIKNATIGFKNKVLCENINLQIFRGQKIAIIGANGIGKSTLLKSVVHEIPFLEGNLEISDGVDVQFFAQEQSYVLNPNKTILEEVLSCSEGEKQARNLLGALLFKADDVFKKINVLSGGEKNRVGLVKLIAKSGNFLILDEPTNHLDMSSCERLTQGLQNYNGTILFVSHDRDFINAVCTHIFVMLPPHLKKENKTGMQALLFEGNLDTLENLSQQAGFPSLFSEPAQKLSENASALSTELSNEEKRKLGSDLKKAKQKLEKNIEICEKKQIEYSAQLLESATALEQISLNEPGNYIKLQEIQKKANAIQELLASEEELWIQMSEEILKL
jgi:ATP-binding cassette, subfamily F, member 3